MTREKLVQTALGKESADLILANANILNVFTGEILNADIAIAGGIIAGVGAYENAPQRIDLSGKYVVPGFINTHCHVESSMVLPMTYCYEEAHWGVTTLITDPHEVANVAGNEGIRFMMNSTRGAPINYYVQLPSCVPCTEFETSGAVLDAAALAELMPNPDVLGLGEMMDYPGVFSGSPGVYAKLNLASRTYNGPERRGSPPEKIIDGHAPSISGKELQAYIAAGVATDHECTTIAEAIEKLRAGMAVLVREGSACRDLDVLIRGIVENSVDTRRMAFCTDDKHIRDLRREGSIAYNVKRSIELGLDTVSAYRMATINAANIYNLRHLGAIAPGYRADLLALDNLEKVSIRHIYKDGKEIDRNAVANPVAPGTCAGLRSTEGSPPEGSKNSVHIAPLGPDSFKLPGGKTQYPVIEIKPDQIITGRAVVQADEVETLRRRGELCKIAVIERHRATGNIGVGLLAGYGLRRGAVATTVAHDSHNLIVLGADDADMRLAAEEIVRMKGGYVFVSDGKVQGSAALPVYGLMSDAAPDIFTAQLDDLLKKIHAAGVPKDVEPLITMSFLALPVIPELRITDKGLFDVEKFCFI
ncbi:adenine deaminase [Spirochaetia bacterium]|nr:adenine deaminase [Spirochaetia bacterium]